jgi:hypothetical protein
MNKIRRTFQVEIPASCLFDASTVAALAEQVEAVLTGRRLQAQPSLTTGPREEFDI